MQGLIYDDQRKGDLAIESFKKAMELNPYSTLNSYHYSLAIAKYKSISEAAHFLEEKSTFLKKSNQPYAASLVDYYRECQINPPNMPDPPFTQ
jgi:tetratricopeptide (TPR) repeat protein